MKSKIILSAALVAATVVGTATPASAQRLASEPAGAPPTSAAASSVITLDPVSALLRRVADVASDIARRAADASGAPRVATAQTTSGTSPHVIAVTAARVRTHPVDGDHIRSLSRGTRIGVACHRLGRDGYWWGLITYPVLGWVRHDLYLPDPWTGRGGSGWRPVPRC